MMTCEQSQATNSTSAVATNKSSSSFCSNIFEKFTCWPQTSAGSLAIVPCPILDDLVLFPGNATRLCLENGTWQAKSNYSQCFIPVPEVRYNHAYVQRIMYYVGFSTSVVALVIALFLFLYFRSLRCLRNTIHCHLIVTFILRCLLWIKMMSTLTYLEIQESQVHQWVCNLIMSLFNYLVMTNFFWMLIEGLYLHTVLVWAFGHDRLRFWHFAVLGWGVPSVFIIAWMIARAKNDNSTCWLPSEDTYLDYIYIVPILSVLVINVLFLASIVYVLVTKLRASNSSQNCLYKKAAKATLILFPLLGMTYLLFCYLPHKNPNFIVLTYVNVFLQSTQGFFVATFYCFLNVEVQNTVKKHLNRWQDGRNLSMRTQTSVVIQGEQVSMHGGYKDEILSKARAAIKKTDNLESTRKDLPLRTVSNERGYSNGIHKDPGNKSLTKTHEFEEWESMRHNGNGSGDVFCQLQDPAEQPDPESDSDIIKEDLV